MKYRCLLMHYNLQLFRLQWPTGCEVNGWCIGSLVIFRFIVCIDEGVPSRLFTLSLERHVPLSMRVLLN